MMRQSGSRALVSHPSGRVTGLAGAGSPALTAACVDPSINSRLYKRSHIRTARRCRGPMPSPAHIRSTIARIASQPPDVRKVASVHKALADPTRLRILQRLAVGDGTVTDLMHHVDLSQPLVSWHLRRLRTAGLVVTRRSGREVICSLSREALSRFHDDEHALLGLAG